MVNKTFPPLLVPPMILTLEPTRDLHWAIMGSWPCSRRPCEINEMEGVSMEGRGKNCIEAR